MPVRLGKIPGTGADAILHSCEDCGESAYFGVGVSFRKALNAAAKGKVKLAKELLGKWYCHKHWRALHENN